jgi:hypothetical protein
MTQVQLLALCQFVAGQSHEAQTAAGVAVCVAGLLRGELLASGDRAICVFDDPVKGSEVEPANAAHAMALTTTIDESAGLRLAIKVAALFGALVDVPKLFEAPA